MTRPAEVTIPRVLVTRMKRYLVHDPRCAYRRLESCDCGLSTLMLAVRVALAAIKEDTQ